MYSIHFSICTRINKGKIKPALLFVLLIEFISIWAVLTFLLAPWVYLCLMSSTRCKRPHTHTHVYQVSVSGKGMRSNELSVDLETSLCQGTNWRYKGIQKIPKSSLASIILKRMKSGAFQLSLHFCCQIPVSPDLAAQPNWVLGTKSLFFRQVTQNLNEQHSHWVPL